MSIREAIKRMDKGGERILLAIKQDGTLAGIITDGDIRRHILKKGGLTGHVCDCLNTKPRIGNTGDEAQKIKELMVRYKLEAVPVVDEHNKVVDLAIWNKFFGSPNAKHGSISTPVVIMAGGKGTRLDPFTKILPKPLIPIGEKPVLEVIMDRFAKYGVTKFYLTVNYKGEMIKSYFDNIEPKYQIRYIWEKEFLGTAGSLRLLPARFANRFIVSNCDIVVELDYSELVKFHKDQKNDLTMVGSLQNHIVPYGVIEFSRNGAVTTIREKPEYDFTVNTGIYVLERTTVRHIPKNKSFNIPDLIQFLIGRGGKVGVFPVSERAYIDIGQWEEYRRNANRFSGDPE
jgi:dTDP-glucose pyrophosphorylase